MQITIADRRAVMASSMSEPDFRDLLRRDPRAAVTRATGRPTPEHARISVIEEQSDAWEFVVPAGEIETELPEPVDARGVVENNVYEMLRIEPSVRDQIVRDPRGFLAEKFQLDVAGVNVREEGDGELLLILPCHESREQLDDAALDLVAGGGSSGNPAGGPKGPDPRG